MVASFGLQLGRNRVDQLLRVGSLELELREERSQNLNARLITPLNRRRTRSSPACTFVLQLFRRTSQVSGALAGIVPLGTLADNAHATSDRRPLGHGPDRHINGFRTNVTATISRQVGGTKARLNSVPFVCTLPGQVRDQTFDLSGARAMRLPSFLPGGRRVKAELPLMTRAIPLNQKALALAG
jgi:hypothetical protein